MHMDEAIKSRRSIGKVKGDPVPRELVEKVIEAAVWAPNHYHTEPWKFVVLTGEGRRRLGRAYAEIAAAALGDLPEEERADRLRREEEKALRAPVIVAVVCSPSDAPRVLKAEELAATHAAVQNLLLSVSANGLGAIWRTGESAYHSVLRRALGLADRDEVVGLIYLGYPDMNPPQGRRTPGTAKTVWLED